jgi:hypothetical protein
VPRDAIGNPLVLPTLGILDEAAAGSVADDLLERHAGYHQVFDAVVQKLTIAAVAHDQAVVGVIERKAVGDALDCMVELLLGHFRLAGGVGQLARALLDAIFHLVAGGSQRGRIGLLAGLHLVESGRNRAHFVARAPLHRDGLTPAVGTADRLHQALQREADCPPIGDQGTAYD